MVRWLKRLLLLVVISGGAGAGLRVLRARQRRDGASSELGSTTPTWPPFPADPSAPGANRPSTAGAFPVDPSAPVAHRSSTAAPDESPAPAESTDAPTDESTGSAPPVAPSDTATSGTTPSDTAPSDTAPAETAPAETSQSADAVTDTASSEVDLVGTVETATAVSDASEAVDWLPPVDGRCPPGYEIKANDNSMIYHVPGGRFYDRPVPERCYATEAAAQRDGYRRAKH